jgi:NAD+ synthase (glutamine-hydrolysing)
MNKIFTRCKVVASCADIVGGAVAYCNLVGGQDELVFDGRSILADSTGKIVSMAKAFEEDLLLADIEADQAGAHVKPFQPPALQPRGPVEEVYQALVLGTRDYTHKNGFQQVLLGISGGIDSAVTAAIAAAALGSQNVICVTMPSRFNSPETIADAKRVADNLGCPLLTIPIEPILTPFHESLKAEPRWNDNGLAYENLQARIRGMILMSLSNQIGALVLTTGNKSEVSVGYSTLYGDSAGGFGTIKDVTKTMVYELAAYINNLAGREVIPEDVIRRVPSAELRPNQRDRDSLPEYDLLDRIIAGYVEQDKSARELVESGLPAEEVERVIRMVAARGADHAESLRQGPPPAHHESLQRWRPKRRREEGKKVGREDVETEKRRDIRHFRDLEVYRHAFKAAMEIFEITKGFPAEERFSMVDQVRRASRSVCANIAEGWRKRRYVSVFRNKMTDAMEEASETQCWLEFASACGYISSEVFRRLDAE